MVSQLIEENKKEDKGFRKQGIELMRKAMKI